MVEGSVAELAERQLPSGVTGIQSLQVGLEVWPCDFGPKQFGWLINQLGEPYFNLDKNH